MTVNQALEKLAVYEKTAFALRHATGILYYDGATVAPKTSAEARALTLGEISRISYAHTTSPENVEMLRVLNDAADSLDPVTARKVFVLLRDYDRTKRIPVDEFAAWTELSVKSSAVWHEAKENNDFASFEPYLRQVFETVRRLALYTDPDKAPYDTLLDKFEPGLAMEKCDAFFSALREKLVPLIGLVVRNADKVDDSPLKADFPVAKQREFSDYLMGIMGIPRDRCIIGETEHPFTDSYSRYDVRITTHYHSDMLASSLYSVVHEGGHALYELNIGEDIAFSCIGGGVSMAIHESQSRFYENIIGRSHAFAGLIYPWLKREFAPRLDGVAEDDFYRMINKSAPSLIRTEADELTYCLHIMIRYELEKRMISGELDASELPAEWNRLYKEYLGVDVPDDKHGILQDSHWSDGNIGYFPSYALGSAYGAQYFNEMSKSFDVYGAVAEGNIEKINGWFREKIWKFGGLYEPDKLFESVCGQFNPDVYVSYLRNKFTDIYSL